MATSSAMSTSNQYIKYTITITQNSQSVTNNNSNVTVSVRFYRTNTGYTTYGTGTVYCKINGTQYSASVTSSQKITNSGIVLFTKTLNIPHNSDGKKTLTCSAWINHQQVTSSEQSYSQALTTIPRGSVLGTISNFTLGNAINIPITKYSSSFTDTLTISLGGTTIKTVNNVTNGYDVSFTSSELNTIYSKLPSATTGSFTFKITTKSGSTQIGTSSKTATGTIPSSVKPSISSVTVSEGNTSVVPSSWGVYVKNKSKLKFVTSASAGSGSSVSSIKTVINGGTYTGSTITTNVIDKSGSLTATITVTDKRGRTTSTTKTVTITDYSNPYVTTLKAIRCDKDGNPLESGTYAKISLKGGITSLSGKNTPSYVIQYKKSTDSEYQNYTFNVTNATIDSYVILSNFEGSSTYNVRAIVSDYFTNFTKSSTIMTVFRTMNFLVGGRGVGFGKLAEKEDVFDIGFKDTYASSNVYLGGNQRVDDEKNIFFNNTGNGTYNHNVKIYGGAGTSPVGLGIWDTNGQHRVVYYEDGAKALRCDPNITLTGFKHIATVIGSSDTSFTSTDIVELNMKSSVKIGSKLTVTNGQVVIGANVNYVKVEASIYAYSGFTDGDLVHCNILRNTTTVYSAIKRMDGTYQTIAGASKIIAVGEGDVIKLCARNQTDGRGLIASNGNATYMTVEVVG